MLVRLCKDSFRRRYGPFGYLTSQLTKKDRIYDEVGALFLEKLDRQAQSVAEIVDGLLESFVDVEHTELEADYVEFLEDLESDGFVVTGAAEGELDRKDRGFTYSAAMPKTARLPTLSSDRVEASRPTEEIMIRYFQEHPTIFGAHVEITGRCNERCVHCYQGETRRDHASRPFLIDVFDQLYELGTVNVTLSGGEPTIHPEFPAVLRAARDHDVMINVLSNGLRLGDDALDALAEVDVNVIQISLYSADPSVHDTITGVAGSHAATVRNIERLLERDVPVQISCPLMRPNHGSYPGVARWCRDRKIRVLSDFILMARDDLDTSNLAHRLDLDQTRQVLEDIWTEDEEYRLLLDQPDPFVDQAVFADQPVCGVCIDNVCFAADGSLYPCSGFSGYVLGNAHETSIRTIWEQSERVLFLRSLRNERFPACVSCDARSFCVRCLARNFNESGGDMFEVADHFCRVAFLNKEVVDRGRAAGAWDAG